MNYYMVLEHNACCDYGLRCGLDIRPIVGAKTLDQAVAVVRAELADEEELGSYLGLDDSGLGGTELTAVRVIAVDDYYNFDIESVRNEARREKLRKAKDANEAEEREQYERLKKKFGG